MNGVWEIDLAIGGEREILVYGPVARLDPAFDRLPDGRIVWVQQRNGDERIWLAELDR